MPDISNIYKNTIMAQIENIKQDGEVMGNRVRVKVIKNKVGVCWDQVEFERYYLKNNGYN